MKSALQALLMAALLPASVAQAQERETLGVSSIFNNDYLGDGQDRWRTGSYTVSKVTGAGSWNGGLPQAFGDLREYRLRAELIAPDNLSSPTPGDRRYVGALSFGVHTHFERGLVEYSLGGDMVLTGPQTGLSWFQKEAHNLLDAPSPSAATDNQIGNAIYPTALFEAAMPVPLSGQMQARPFVEVQAGVESFVRIGSDLRIGDLGQGQLALRDVTTGQLYTGTRNDELGMAFLLGGDIAFVGDSFYLPSSDGYSLTSSRSRLRAGMSWQGEKLGVFYGLTWMSKEFKAQPEGQVLGTVNLQMRF